MSIGSSMNAGVLGLQANATRMSTIADNIANSGTVGYKRADVQFVTMVTDMNRRTYSAGGVRTQVRRDIAQAGLVQATQTSTDFAVQGRGFLPVVSTTTPETINFGDDTALFTKAGSFRPDKDGYLRNSAGLYLQGWPLNLDGTLLDANPARDVFTNLETVNVSNIASSASATTRISYSGNLPADATDPLAADDNYVQSLEYFDPLGRSNRLVMEFSNVRSGPLPTDPVIPNTWNLSVTDTADPANPVVAEFELQFNDVAPAAGTLQAVTPVGANPAGVVYNNGTGEVELLTAAGNPLSVDIGRLNALGGLSQFSGTFAPNQIIKNGSQIGSVTNVEITAKGIVEAILSNGERQPIYKVPIADIVNENQLNSEDGNAFSLSADSGGFYLWDAGEGPVGSPLGYALESSTTDIARELTSMIETQRAYSSNAKIIQTADEMLQETTNLKR